MWARWAGQNLLNGKSLLQKSRRGTRVLGVAFFFDKAWEVTGAVQGDAFASQMTFEVPVLGDVSPP